MKKLSILVMLMAPLGLQAVTITGQQTGMNEWTYDLTFAPMDNYSIFQPTTTITLTGLFGMTGAAGPTSTDFPPFGDAINTNWIAEVLNGGTAVRWTHIGPGTGNWTTEKHIYGFRVYANAINGLVLLSTSGFARDGGGFNSLDITGSVAGPAGSPNPSVPVILTPPSDQTVCPGTSASFSVVAIGNPQPDWQWQYNGSDIVGATNSTYAIVNIQTNDAGHYRVVVSNALGVVTSVVARLTVTSFSAPAIIGQPANQTVAVGSIAAFYLSATGCPEPVYQWQYNGANIVGATNSSYKIFNVQTNHAGQCRVVVSNAAGVVVSAPATLSVDASLYRGKIAYIYSSGNGIAGRFQAFLQNRGYNTVLITGAAVSTADYLQYDLIVIGPDTGYIYDWDYPEAVQRINTSQKPILGIGEGGSTFFSQLSLRTGWGYGWIGDQQAIVASLPAHVVFHESHEIPLGGAGEVNVYSNAVSHIGIYLPSIPAGVIAIGRERYDTNHYPLTFEQGRYFLWGFDGDPAAMTGAGQDLFDNVIYLLAFSAPVIITPPSNQTVCFGTSASFSVVASGNPAPDYQWEKEDMAIAGATNATYTMVNIQTNDAGHYRVVVSNALGVVTSAVARLTVIFSAPAIISQPANQTIAVGSIAAFYLSATGCPEPVYQWQYNGANIVGATNSSYKIVNVQTNHAGQYRAVVSNAVGVVVSAPATLSVDVSLYRGKIAYIYSCGSGTAGRFQAFLQNRGYNTVLITGNAVSTTDYLQYDMIAIGPDTGFITNWDYPEAIQRINTSQKPILGIGEGGYAFFGQLSLRTGFGNGWHGAQQAIVASLPAHAVFHEPHEISLGSADEVNVYSNTVGQVGIYLPSVPSGVIAIGRERYDTNHYSLTFEQGRYFLWGFDGDPATMTGAGQDLFDNVIYLLTPPSAPVIITPPSNQTVCPGTSASFSVVASGNPAPDYQWKKEDMEIAGATNAIYTMVNVQTNDAGPYRVVVRNALGSVTSQVATLTVTVLPPTFQVEPPDRYVIAGVDVTFNARVTGAAPLFFQWFFNDAAIPNATNTALIVSNVQLNNQGNYFLVATNFLGAATSRVARLSLGAPAGASFHNPAPIIIQDDTTALPYPSSIEVSGLPGTVASVTVTLYGLFHTWPGDIGILLVGPDGRTALLMSDVGLSYRIEGVTLTFDDAAPSSLPYESQIYSGTYRPTGDEDSYFYPPATRGPYDITLSVFNGTNPNGVWNLFVVDMEEDDIGEITNGWRLTINGVGGGCNPLENWFTRNSGTSNLLQDVTYGNGLFVAVASGTSILTSTNGILWTKSSAGHSYRLNGITYGNGRFVAVGDSGIVSTSTNGITWWSTHTSYYLNLHSVAYGNGTFVAVGTDGSFSTSTNNGTNWTDRFLSTENALAGVAYGNNRFVAVGTNGTIVASTNGIYWANVSPGIPISLTDVAFGNGLFVATGLSGYLLTSTDGLAWGNTNIGVSVDLAGVGYGNGSFLAVGSTGSGGLALSSPDGVNWIPLMLASAPLADVAFGNGSFVAVGMNGTILQSLVTFIIVSSPNSLTIRSGQHTAFAVTALSSCPISYQWLCNGLNIPNATNSNYSISNTCVADEGNYSVVVSDFNNSITSAPVRLTVGVDPVIRQQPRHLTVVTGSIASLTVAATGYPMPLGYRWKRDGASVANMLLNQTNCTFTISNVVLGQGGAYTVVVTNSAYSMPGAISAIAYLTVVVPPADLTVGLYSNATFTVSAGAGSSTSRLRYQWQFNGTNLPAQTNSSLTLTNVRPIQEGPYTVIVTNPTNYPAAFTAALTVLTPPDYDSDGDGMPDWWERAHGLNPFDPADANQDPDHDGMTNLQEYLAGTDPQDGQSVLKLQIALSGSVQLRFNAVTNMSYLIECSDVMRPFSWNPFAEISAPSTNRLVEITDPLGNTNRFYRIVLR